MRTETLVAVFVCSVICGFVGYAAMSSPWMHHPHPPGTEYACAAAFFALSFFAGTSFAWLCNVAAAARHQPAPGDTPEA